ncbi:HNH endonuclease family protein, partial [Bifidobacterium sp.]|uniref:HNH endonuclease family protein n=1 Tax=Bifidobacterium sp. TaxID=41200 RepID=UPI003D7C5DED
MTRRGPRDGTHFRRRLFNADGPVERILILLVVAVVAGVTIGLLMPKVNPTVGELTGEYTASGTAAQTLQQLTVDDEPRRAGYDRDSFGFRQTDDDGNGCDVREDVLARDLTDVRYQQGCKVQSGTLSDPYTGKTIRFVRGVHTSSAVQIDHVVALENAWQSGANTWDRAKRVRFGNDMYNLLAV